MKILYKALIAKDISMECIGDEELGLQPGDMVIIRCEKYQENAVIDKKLKEGIENLEAFDQERAAKTKGRRVEGERTPLIMRRATEEDMATIRSNDEQSANAQNATRSRIEFHNLDMKLVHTHYSFDRKLLLIQFSAEGRVDFRELLRDLSTLFHSRVELRQIGVRDEAVLLGGVGTCGRPFCCVQFLKGFNSINVKMAKQQGIAINPQNISGCCGRLKCCLAFEAEYYKDAPLKKAPVKEEQAELQNPPEPGKRPAPRREGNSPRHDSSRRPEQPRSSQQGRRDNFPHEQRKKPSPAQPPRKP